MNSQEQQKVRGIVGHLITSKRAINEAIDLGISIRDSQPEDEPLPVPRHPHKHSMYRAPRFVRPSLDAQSTDLGMMKPSRLNRHGRGRRR